MTLNTSKKTANKILANNKTQDVTDEETIPKPNKTNKAMIWYVMNSAYR